MSEKKYSTAIILIILICCSVMTVVDGIIVPDYWVKSVIKIVFFLGLPFIYFCFDSSADLKSLFVPRKKGIKTALMLCLPIYIIIVGAYLLFKDIFDFSGITASLTSGIGVNKDNFVRLTRVEPITVSLVAFYRFACVYFCKASALLQISRYAFQKKAAERNSSTCQINIFLKRRSRRTQ